jgi:hypothetical protein
MHVLLWLIANLPLLNFFSLLRLLIWLSMVLLLIQTVLHTE